MTAHDAPRTLVRLAAAGDEQAAAVLLTGLDATQLRELAAVVATHADTAVARSTGPQAVCQAAVDAAAIAFNTTPEAILGSARSSNIKSARHVAMTAAHRNDLTLSEVARYFDKHHTSVMHAVNQVEADLDLDAVSTRIADGVRRRTETLRRTRDSRAEVRREAMVNAPGLRIVESYPPDQICAAAATAAAELFGTTPELVRGEDRHRAAVDARAVAMAVAKQNGLSDLQVAVFFDKHRTSVIDAVTRTQTNPLLRDAASRIATQLPAAGQPENNGPHGDRGTPAVRGRLAWAPSPGAAAERRSAGPSSTTVAVAR